MKQCLTLAGLMALSLLAAGCASSHKNWTKSDVPRSQQDSDQAECQYQAKAATASYHTTPSEEDRKKTGGMGTAVGDGIVIAEKQIELVNACMRAKGYVSQ